MRLATWNLNSIRARHDRLLALLERHRPDVLCVQELKVDEAGFPWEAVRTAGYHACVHAQRTYNGVAILSRAPAEDVRVGLGDAAEDPQARLVSARIEGVRVLSAYFPNGEHPSSEKFAYKLSWMRRLREKLAREHRPDEPLALAGDFNVAPSDLDVRNAAKWAGSVLCHPEARAALVQLRDWGLIDSLRALQPELAVYSWWDYQQLGFPKNDGLRIDHIDVTAPLAARLVEIRVDRDERKGDKPSDHAPVIVELR